MLTTGVVVLEVWATPLGWLLRWLRKKSKRLHGYKRAKRCWDGTTSRDPGMFAHWQWNRAAW